jgi:hypothetical protein
LKKRRVVVLQNEDEVGNGVPDGKLHHVEEEIGLRVEEEEGAAVVVGNKIVKTKHVASIENHAHSVDLKEKLMILVSK